MIVIAVWLIAVSLGYSGAARADAQARQPDDAASVSDHQPSKPFKLTLGHYRYDPALQGTDVNLRYRRAAATAWAGFYEDREFGVQWRAGLEHAISLPLETPASLQFSGQLASRGFLGGSVTLEVGEPWFASFGFGRTNNKPYFNLNFDPNDAVSLAFGWRGRDGLTAYLFAVRDNRFNPGQQNLHAVVRLPVGEQQRLSIDLQRKSGLAGAQNGVGAQAGGNGGGGANGGHDWALLVSWDWKDWSVRLADDRRQNFSEVNAIRLSLAYRF